MAVTFQNLISKLKSNEYAPVYFLQGEEPYFIDEVVKYIEKNAMDESFRSFNQVVFYGKDTDIASILSHAKGFPMMVDRKVVIVKEAQGMADINKEQGVKMLINYLENPQPSTVLVFGYKYKVLDKRKKLGKIIDKHTVLLNSTKFYDNQLPTWVDSFVKSRRRKIDQKALQIIVEYIGNNPTRISNEIDKMLINMGNEPMITADLIYKNIGVSKEYNVFELQKALTFKNVVKANEIISYFKSDSKSNPIIPVIANLFSFFNKILLVHDAKDKSDKKLASLLGVSPFFVKDYTMATRNYPLVKVLMNIRHLKIADMKSKGIGYPTQPEGEILRELIFNVLH